MNLKRRGEPGYPYIQPAHNGQTIRKVKNRMKITDVAKIVSGPNPHHVDARKIYDTKNAIAVVITLQPGESLKKHMTPVDVFFYVLEGTGIVEIGDERASCTKDMLDREPGKDPAPVDQ